MNTHSLSFRLVAWYAGVLTIAFVLLGLLIFFSLRHYLEANLLDVQARRARQIANTMVASMRSSDETALGGEVENPYSPEANDRFIRVTRADGTVVYASGPPKDARFNPALVPPLPLGAHTETRKVGSAGGSLLVAVRDTDASDGTSYRVEVGASGATIGATLTHVFMMLAVGLSIAVAVAVTGGFVLARRALVPVERIAHKAEETTQHDLSERLPVVHSGDKIERLSIFLNHTIARLEDAIHGSKQFVADASVTIAEQMSLLAEDKRVRLTCIPSGEVPLQGDRARLKQGVVNLLYNTIKYTATGGQVYLQVRREGAYAVLDVSDIGVGIPARALPHVFKRFFRVDRSRSRASREEPAWDFRS